MTILGVVGWYYVVKYIDIMMYVFNQVFWFINVYQVMWFVCWNLWVYMFQNVVYICFWFIYSQIVDSVVIKIDIYQIFNRNIM